MGSSLQRGSKCLFLWCWCPLFLALCDSVGVAQGQHALSVLINAHKEHQVCLITNDDITATLTCETAMVSTVPIAIGKKVDLNVTNRKFLSDYRLHFDTENGPGLPRTRPIKVVPLLVRKPTGTQEPPFPLIKRKTAMDYVVELLDPDIAPTEGKTDQLILHGQVERIQEDAKSFQEEFDAIIGKGGVLVDCLKVGQLRTAYELAACLNWELEQTQKDPWSTPPFRGEDKEEEAFKELIDRVEILLAETAAVSERVQTSALLDLGQRIQLEGDRYKTAVTVMAANRNSLIEAETLLDAAVGPNPLAGIKIRTELKKRALGAHASAGLDGNSVSTEAEANLVSEELLNRWKYQDGVPRKQAAELKSTLLPLDDLSFGPDVDAISRQIEFELPRLASFLNDKENELVGRLEFIYEHSEVQKALVRPIDLEVAPSKDTVAFVVERTDGCRGFSLPQDAQGMVFGSQTSVGDGENSGAEVPVARGVFSIDNGCRGLKKALGICQELGP